MKETEVRSEYLKIASSRLSRKGDKTFDKLKELKTEPVKEAATL